MESESSRATVSATSGARSSGSGSGSHGPTYSSRRARADLSRSMHNLVTTADR